MAYLEQFQLNVYAGIILVILLVVIRNRMRVETYGKRLLNMVIAFAMMAIVLEPLTWIFDGQDFIGAYFLEYTTNVGLLLLAPIISSLMMSYVRHQLQDSIKPILRGILCFIPFWITIAMLTVNLFVPIYFSVDPTTNAYSSGDFLWVHYVMILGIYIYMMSVTMTYAKDKDRSAVMIFTIFFFLPILGMAFQIVNSRINYSWNFIVLSILVIVLFLETADGELDFLTGLFNRRSYEAYVSQLVQQNTPFQVVYIDLDRFKDINDEQGHLVGDKVLIEFGKHISDAFERGSFVARLGGDEFMVVVEHVINLEETISHLRESLKEGSEQVQTLKFSYGVQQYKTGMTLDQLYAAVDTKMYQYKRANKNLKRRRSDD
jgi:diguanylate cyclase (GGDEF)-like protein